MVELCGRVNGVDGLSPEACVESRQEDGQQEDFVCPACGHREHKVSKKISCIPDADWVICEGENIHICSKCGVNCDTKPCNSYGKENFRETPEIIKLLSDL